MARRTASNDSNRYSYGGSSTSSSSSNPEQRSIHKKAPRDKFSFQINRVTFWAIIFGFGLVLSIARILFAFSTKLSPVTSSPGSDKEGIKATPDQQDSSENRGPPFSHLLFEYQVKNLTSLVDATASLSSVNHVLSTSYHSFKTMPGKIETHGASASFNQSAHRLKPQIDKLRYISTSYTMEMRYFLDSFDKDLEDLIHNYDRKFEMINGYHDQPLYKLLYPLFLAFDGQLKAVSKLSLEGYEVAKNVSTEFEIFYNLRNAHEERIISKSPPSNTPDIYLQGHNDPKKYRVEDKWNKLRSLQEMRNFTELYTIPQFLEDTFEAAIPVMQNLRDGLDDLVRSAMNTSPSESWWSRSGSKIREQIMNIKPALKELKTYRSILAAKQATADKQWEAKLKVCEKIMADYRVTLKEQREAQMAACMKPPHSESCYDIFEDPSTLRRLEDCTIGDNCSAPGYN
jgi:hypothetical protein